MTPNYSAIFALPSVLFRPGLLLPHISVGDIRNLDWIVLKSLGVKSVVFDKDNCLTKPHQDAIVPKLEESLENCIKIFGFKNVVILSNSSGSSDDPNSIGAESLSRNLLSNSNSKIQVMLHENKKPSYNCSKEVLEWYSSNNQFDSKNLSSSNSDLENKKNESSSLSSLSSSSSSSSSFKNLLEPNFIPRILFIGDRPTTDIITGHRISKALKKKSSFRNSNFNFNSRNEESNLNLDLNQDQKKEQCLTVLSTNLWEKEKLGTRFMRSLEYSLIRFFVKQGIQPGGNWSRKSSREISRDMEKRSPSASFSSSSIEKVGLGLGLISNENPWQNGFGIVIEPKSKSKFELSEILREVKPKTDENEINQNFNSNYNLSKNPSSPLSSSSSTSSSSSSRNQEISNSNYRSKPSFSNLILPILPIKIQLIFKGFISILSFWPINQILNLMKDGWELIIKGFRIGIVRSSSPSFDSGYFSFFGNSNERGNGGRKIERNRFDSLMESGFDNKKRKRNLHSEMIELNGENSKNINIIQKSSTSLSSSTTTTPFSIKSSNQNQAWNSNSNRRFSSFSSNRNSSSSSSNKFQSKSISKSKSISTSNPSNSSSNPNSNSHPTPNSPPPSTSSSNLPSKNWLAALSALILLPTCYLLGARLHEYREESAALKEEERIRNLNQGLNQEEIKERVEMELKEEEKKKKGEERDREEKVKSLELAHFHLTHEKKEVEEKLLRLRERRFELEGGK